MAKYYKHSQCYLLPSVAYLAEKLNLSPAYLSDLLKSYTGLSAKQHINESVINKAKELLTITELSVIVKLPMS
ncbi:MAG: hypothetical protein N4A49_08680 [Marinifilaceae bacterium]|nr:hypothetical protein [Marinifilaceae bacterium]